MSQTIRSLLVVLVGGAALVLATDRIVHSPAFHIPKDFLEYWAAGRLNLRGENPYDPERLLSEQRTADPDRAAAVMMWNPPPALAVYTPLAWFPPRLAALLWIGFQLLAVMLACDLLWRAYAPGRPRWVAQLVGLSFVGTWWVVAYGQNTGLLVLGLAGFLHYTRKGKPLSAGACAALTAFKPHLLAGFGVLLLADAVTRRGRITLAAGLGVIALSLGLRARDKPGSDRAVRRSGAKSGAGGHPVARLDAASAELLAADAARAGPVLGAVRPVRGRVRRAPRVAIPGR